MLKKAAHILTITYERMNKKNGRIDGLMYKSRVMQQTKTLKRKRVKISGGRLSCFLNTYRLVSKGRKHDCFFHRVHHQLPQLL